MAIGLARFWNVRGAETGLPEKVALNGENFLWRAPFGGRSAPIVVGNRVIVQNPVGHGADEQERVMALAGARRIPFFECPQA